MQYGGLGMVLGHEITHSFDVGGRQISAEGKKTQSGLGWWTEAAFEGFKNLISCMDNQYRYSIAFLFTFH